MPSNWLLKNDGKCSISVFKTSVLDYTYVPVATFEFDMVY